MTKVNSPNIAPLQQALSDILLGQVAPLSEFELIRKLQAPPFELLREDALQGTLSLFQTHFLVFHGLYRLRQQWRAEGFADLRIEPLAIEMQPLPEQAHAQHQDIEAADPLAQYYLDIEQLHDTRTVDVEALLDGFWQRFSSGAKAVSADERSQAMMVLEFDAMPDNLRQLKRRYRQQVHLHHPDKGGDAQTMQQLQWAFGILQGALEAGVHS